jgi:ribosome recycling factor
MNDWKSCMTKAIERLAEELRVIRSGTVSPGLVQGVRVARDGKQVAIGRLGTIKSQGDRILIEPFDRNDVSNIVKSLNAARLGAYALNPSTVAVSVPPISLEQRTEIARHVKKLGEDAKIVVRSIRQQARKRIDAAGRGSRNAVQDTTDAAIKEIDSLVAAKLRELQ